MAKNIGGRRIGAIRGRTQFRLPSGHYAKRNRWTGEILSVKADLEPYKNVVIEKPQPTPTTGYAFPARGDTSGRVSLPLLDRPIWRARPRTMRKDRAVALTEPAIARGIGRLRQP
jgi:hypothetical protein